MTAASDAWSDESGVAVDWTFRPLSAFNDQPLTDLARGHDLLIVDHPMVLAYRDVLLPLDGAVRTAGTATIGPTTASYAWGGHDWAVPTDVACHVDVRSDTALTELGVPPPRTWPDVLELAHAHPGAVVASLTGADALCHLVTLAASSGTPVRADMTLPLAPIEALCRLAALVDVSSFDAAPPDVLRRIAAGDAAYCPALFGYATYLHENQGLMTYGTVPAFPGHEPHGILGGSGLAVTRQCARPDAATAFATWLATVAGQWRLAEAGGQAAAARVWDERAPSPIRAFVLQTRAATASAVIRPRHSRWSRFQTEAGEALRHMLAAGASAEAIHHDLERRRRRTFEHEHSGS